MSDSSETTDFRVVFQKWHECKCWYISLPSGVVRLETDLQEKQWYVVGLAVSEGKRRQGIAAALLDKCEELSNHSTLSLWLEPDAPVWLIKYYLRRGYKILEDC